MSCAACKVSRYGCGGQGCARAELAGPLCSGSPAALLGDPHAIKLAGLGLDVSMGDVLPTVVWPSDVEAKKRQIDPSMQATNQAVFSCTALDDGSRMAWSKFFAAWISFRAEDVPWFGAANKYDEALDYGRQLGGWQDQLRAKCTIPGPPPIAPKELEESTISAVKWGAAAVIAVAVVYGVRTVWK